LSQEEKLNKNSDSRIDYKPSLNTVESRNKLYDYSKTKTYEEDLKKFSSMPRVKEEEIEEIQAEIEEEEAQIEELDSKTKRLKEIQMNLPVPIDRKDDEAFKILKIKEMKRVSMTSNKSTKATETENVPNHRKKKTRR
jgi:hypothetical protein